MKAEIDGQLLKQTPIPYTIGARSPLNFRDRFPVAFGCLSVDFGRLYSSSGSPDVRHTFEAAMSPAQK